MAHARQAQPGPALAHLVITLEIFLDLVIRPIRSEPEVALWWDGLQLDSREDWNEDWAIVDGAGYHDIQVVLL